MTGGYVGSPKKPIALYDSYTKAQADGKFPDKTSATPQDFTAMPTVGGDPIVESGSNSDGSWTRWADGSQKAHQRITTNANAAKVWTYPIPFVVSPYCEHAVINQSPRISVMAAITTTDLELYSFNESGDGSVTPLVDITANGDWK